MSKEREGMNINEAFEKEAAEFYNDTGYMMFGKDDSRGIHTHEERQEAYRKWKKSKIEQHHEQASPLPVPLEDREELNISPLTNPNKKYKIIENGKIEGYWNEDNTPFIITCPEQLQDILLYVLNNLEKK